MAIRWYSLYQSWFVSALAERSGIHITVITGMPLVIKKGFKLWVLLLLLHVAAGRSTEIHNLTVKSDMLIAKAKITHYGEAIFRDTSMPTITCVPAPNPSLAQSDPKLTSWGNQSAIFQTAAIVKGKAAVTHSSLRGAMLWTPGRHTWLPHPAAGSWERCEGQIALG